MHDHLNQLRIISKVRVGQRLDTTNGITVYEDSIFNWFLRKYYHDNKDEGTRYLQDLYRSIDQTVEQLTTDINNIIDTTQKTRKIQIALNLAEKIQSSIHGIENLSKTYASYPKTTATLEGIVQDFAIVTYTQLLDIIPHKKFSKVIKKNINYNGAIFYLGLDAFLESEHQHSIDIRNSDQHSIDIRNSNSDSDSDSSCKKYVN